VAEAVARVEGHVAGHGRVLVRYSGTEPLLRVMIEGEREDEIRVWAEQIARVVREELS
jgi:phosphoglucosamine mutase